MEPVIVIPPIRTCLEDIQSLAGEPWKTAKEWYLYWQRSGEKLAGLVTSGTHAGRPADAPEGALYTETDRGDVVYQFVDGHWQYVAGTMWGTLSPDQRPTDLGPNDAGFEFRSVDSNQYLNGRDFLWSQSEWIEITPVRYGTHADRLAAGAASLWSGMLWVEIDRGSATYQNQNGTWHYLSGTMYGTLSPDQRPADLGVNDAGFDFRGTDQQREFIWSQTVWVEVTAHWVTVANGIAYTEGGNAGIGTANPSERLTVSGVRTSTYSAGDATTWSDALVENRTDTGNTATGIGFSITGSYPGNSSVVAGIAAVRTSGVAEPQTDLAFITRPPGAAQTERMRITAGGNVGISKTNPGSRLAVSGLPSSASGLTSGDIWYDPAAGNVLKVIP